jgi:ATP-dependent helicase/nuclease subunit A
MPVFVTPTALKRREQELAETATGSMAAAHPANGTPGMLIGELAHRFLEHWDFGSGPEDPGDRVARFVDAVLPMPAREQAAAIAAELTEILRAFVSSGIYTELAEARILGREVPLLMPWGDRVMEGVIDLVYERKGLLYLADYKTDRFARAELRRATERYRAQAQIYSQAARLSLGREIAAFKLIFLRLGESVEVQVNSGEELWLF